MFRTMFQRRRPRAVVAAPVVAAGVTPVGAPVAWAATAVTAVTATTYQRVDGFGFSQAFGQAKVLGGALGLSAANQREVLDLLFDRSRGAGFSVLRNLIDSGAANTIAPTAPGRHGNDMVNTIARDCAAFSALDVASGHGYSSPPTTPFTQAAKPTWMTEWANFDPFTTAWTTGRQAPASPGPTGR